MPKVASNTGPILSLAHVGQLDLVRHLFDIAFIPPAVHAEVKDEKSLAAVSQAMSAGWPVAQDVYNALAVQLLREELDPGESEAIVLAKELPADLVLIDERAATRRARTLDLRVIGTLGVLLLGKRAGPVAAVKPLMERLVTLDFHIGTELYEQVLKEEHRETCTWQPGLEGTAHRGSQPGLNRRVRPGGYCRSADAHRYSTCGANSDPGRRLDASVRNRRHGHEFRAGR